MVWSLLQGVPGAYGSLTWQSMVVLALQPRPTNNELLSSYNFLNYIDINYFAGELLLEPKILPASEAIKLDC